MRVMDVSGRLIRSLIEANLEAGTHVIPWDGLDAMGCPASQGVYLYDLDVIGRTGREKVVRIR
jgi:hypothetical protein